MSLKLNYSIKRLIRDNIIYIGGLFALNLVLIFVTGFFYSQYQKNIIKIKTLNKELSEYSQKKDLLDFKNQVIKNEVDLDYINQILTILIPSEEDYFSIVAALEKLSLETNFIISAYNINVSKSTQEKLSLVIEGQGDPNDFLRFLQEYNYFGGRLITIDQINFSQTDFSGSKINISVYAGKGSGKKIAKTEKIDSRLIENILEKVTIDLKSEEDSGSDYPTKSDPF